MGWVYLLIAGLLEIVFTTFLNLSQNFTRIYPTIGFVVFSGLSFTMLSMSLQWIPLGTAYAVWTGIGAFGTAVIGILYFSEPIDMWRLFFLFCLIASIIGLRLVSPH